MISLMTPTRARPGQLRVMASAARDTAIKPIEIIVWMDEDDPRLMDNLKVCRDLKILYRIGPRSVIHSARWDKCLPLATGELLFHMNDDVILRTPGWDEMVEAEFEKYPDRLIMAHGDDLGCQGENFGCHPIVHRRWVETLGFFIPDCFDGEYGDAVVNFIANRIGRRKFLPFVSEHMHRLFGKAETDETTLGYLARQAKQNPAQIYKDREADWIAAADELRALLGTPWKG
jgi:hypothetical protein